MEEKGLSVADALALSRDNDNDMFGGGNAWWLIIIILFLGMFGRGYGGNGGGDGVNTVVVPSGGFGGWGGTSCCTPATQQGVTDAFNFSALSNGITSTHDSVVDGFYQNNLATTNLGTAIQTSFAASDMNTLQGFNGVQSSLCNGFNGLNSNLNNGFNAIQSAIANSDYQRAQCCCENREAIMQSNFNNQAGFNNVATTIATNACDIERGQDDIKYLMAQNQNATIVSIDRLGDRLIDYMNQKEMDDLRTELQNAKFQISQAAQTEQLLNSLQPISRPAYLTASPYQSIGYNAVNGCGCGNF